MSSIRSLRSVVHDMHEVFEAGNWPTIGDLRDLQNWSHRASVEYCSGDKKALLAHQAALAHNLAANLPRREQLELVLDILRAVKPQSSSEANLLTAAGHKVRAMLDGEDTRW